MAAVQPAGPLPRMMTLECVVVMNRSAAFAGLAMSYRNGKGFRQDGSKAKAVHKVRAYHFSANFCPAHHDSRNIIAPAPGPRYSTSPHPTGLSFGYPQAGRHRPA